MPHIVILDGYTENPGDLSWSGFADLGELTVYDRTAPADAAARIGAADIVLTNKVPVTAAVMDACPALRYIGVLATGVNVVDLPAAAARGLTVTNIPAYSTASVAQFTFALLLEICHHVGEHTASVRRGVWANSPDFTYWDYPLIELAGKTMGLVGFGQIGQAVARIAQAFGLRVLACNARGTTGVTESGVTLAPFEDVIARSDIVSLHCPLTDANRGLIDAAAIGRMKPGAILLNTARGPLLVERDVADALNAGRLSAAAVDVVAEEPIRPDNPLLTARNCFITPHIAWAPFEARARLM
ncbi:MAG: D-2-hydroxyacid dehydrogenase, partial [Propionibacteriaceae bacterium]|nr:D-2-hydroxyacid dehydrogenase [Propionibacteriaceae bacterium]